MCKGGPQPSKPFNRLSNSVLIPTLLFFNRPCSFKNAVQNVKKSIFALEQSVIILRASHSPMTLQTSPVLSTPHFILLHAGRFTVLVQRQRLETTGKTVALAFPGKNPIREKKKKVCSHSHAERVSLKIQRGYLKRGWGLFDVICKDQIRGLKSAWAVGNSAVFLLYSLLPVGVFVCDRAPHCCSDVFSLCLYSMTVTPS